MTDEGILVFLVFEIPEWLTQTLKAALAYLFIYLLSPGSFTTGPFNLEYYGLIGTHFSHSFTVDQQLTEYIFMSHAKPVREN